MRHHRHRNYPYLIKRAKRWIQERLETALGKPDYDLEKKRDILRWTTAARKLEDYLHRRYVGQKRFLSKAAKI